MKQIEHINWMWMKRNLHETGFEKLIEKINEIIDRANGIVEEEITKDSEVKD